MLTWMGRAVRSSAVGAVLILASTLPAQKADAQDLGTGRILSPEETRQCICMGDEVETVRVQTDPLEQEFKRLDELIERARPNVDTADPAEVDSFRRLYGRREALRQQLQAERGSRLSGIVGQYNRLCANQRMLKLNVDAVRADPNACLK